MARRRFPAVLGLVFFLLAELCGAEQTSDTGGTAVPGTVSSASSAQEGLIPEPIQKKLAAGPLPYDQPAEAAAFWAVKRAPVGSATVPVELYLTALEKKQRMPLYSSRLGRYIERGTAAVPEISALGTWESLGPGNIGGRTRALVIHPTTPDTMYAGGVAGGIWKTTNGGASWTALDDMLLNLAIGSLVMDPGNSNVLYAGTGEGFFNGDSVRGAGIFKTTNAGVTWTPLASTNTANFHYVNDLVVGPNNSNVVYAATRTGVWRSGNGGTSWSQVLSPGVFAGCLDLAVRTDQADDYLFASCGSFEQATVYRNTDAAPGGSGTWDPVLTETNMGRTHLAIAPSNQATIYAIAASVDGGSQFLDGLHKVFRSTNGGSNWTTRVSNINATKLNTLLLSNPVIATLVECGFGGANAFLNQGWYDNVIAVDPVDADRVWVGGIDLFRSEDGGQNWGVASYWWFDPGNPDYAHADQHAIVFHPNYNGTSNQQMFVASDGGVFRTDNAVSGSPATGATATCSGSGNSVAWTSLNNNYGVTQFYHGTPYPDGATYFGGTQDNGTLKSDDVAGEQAWEEVFGGDGGYTAVDSGNTNILFVETTRLSLRKSTNGGSSFSPATSGISEASGNFLFIAPFAMDPANSQRLWIGGFFLWRTTNSAGVWSQASAITSGTGSVSAIAVAPTDGNKVLAGMSDGIIHRTDQGLTSNAGTSWPFTQPVAGAFVSSVTFDPTDDNIAYATYSTFGVAHVWKSTNSGATWTSIDGAGPTALPDIPAHSIVVDPANTNKLVVGTDLGVFVSTDGGANWAAENTGFANVVTESLSVQSNGSTRLFAFTHGRGAWRVPLPANTAPNVSITMPNDGDSFNIDVDPTIDFAATAADVEEGDLSSGLGWTSNQDGSIGSGASFSTTLSVAVHQITAEVTDGGGLDGSDQIEIAVGTTSCPADLTISGTISSNQDRQTVRTATLQSLTVTASGNLNVRAGQSAVFVPPVTIAGDLEVEISGNPCP